jgi:hypothetical protein
MTHATTPVMSWGPPRHTSDDVDGLVYTVLLNPKDER